MVVPDWFDFKGIRSTDFGVYVQEYPAIAVPNERVDFRPVPGRSGYLTVTEGKVVYEDILLSAKCYVRSAENIDEIGAWLRGAGTLVWGFMPDRYYITRCVNQIDVSQIMRGRAQRSFAAVFRCQPYRYLYPPLPAQAITNGGILTNLGSAESESIITVTGTGDIEITIGEKTLYIADLDESITIDNAAGLAYDGGINLTGNLTGDFPLTIPPGANAISIAGAVTSVLLTPNWRYV